LAAAIIFIALVIWRVLFTLRIRRRKSRTFAMVRRCFSFPFLTQLSHSKTPF